METVLRKMQQGNEENSFSFTSLKCLIDLTLVHFFSFFFSCNNLHIYKKSKWASFAHFINSVFTYTHWKTVSVTLEGIRIPKPHNVTRVPKTPMLQELQGMGGIIWSLHWIPWLVSLIQLKKKSLHIRS